MRTQEQLEREAQEWRDSLSDDDSETMHPHDLLDTEGVADAIQWAIGKTDEEIAAAIAKTGEYRSWGDDAEDAYQFGYMRGLRWASGEFEWDEG